MSKSVDFLTCTCNFQIYPWIRIHYPSFPSNKTTLPTNQILIPGIPINSISKPCSCKKRTTTNHTWIHTSHTQNPNNDARFCTRSTLRTNPNTRNTNVPINRGKIRSIHLDAFQISMISLEELIPPNKQNKTIQKQTHRAIPQIN